MVHAELPSTFAGWLVALGASIVGFITGFLFISLCERFMGAS